MDIQNITPDIYRIRIPFSNIYTTVFVVCTPGAVVLFDTASKASDVEQYIAPTLQKLGLTPDHIFISHNHGDHSGGLERAAQLYPNARIISQNPDICGKYGARVYCPESLGALQILPIPGHTIDAMGLLDTRTGTLLSGDCLQAYGIFGAGAWGSAIRCVDEHLQAIQMLRKLKIEQIVTAHDYHPFQQVIRGKEEITAFLDCCIQALRRVKGIVQANYALDDEQLMQLCNDGTLPRIGVWVVAGVRKARNL